MWQVATVAEVRRETETARTIVLDVPEWPGHLAGQHLDVRLTAPDGYRASRSYSIASAWSGGTIELTVEQVPGGEGTDVSAADDDAAQVASGSRPAREGAAV